MQITRKSMEMEENFPSPLELAELVPATHSVQEFVDRTRQSVRDILFGEDPRALFIVGPCSIHDVDEAMEYANRLHILSDSVSAQIKILMRVYVEKPRTTTGWKGLIEDPNVDGSQDILRGLELSRMLFREVNHLGLGIATEVLSPTYATYLHDLVSWSSIGARTVESQTHRELASGLPSIVGVKNNTNGNVDVAVNAIQAMSEPHSFLAISDSGKAYIKRTHGNPHTHLVLRGGNSGPNYDELSIRSSTEILRERSLPEAVVVDCSHGNSNKRFLQQMHVADEVVNQRTDGCQAIKGLMLESNLNAGNQSIVDKNQLKKGVSVTDPCLGWEETESLILRLAERMVDSTSAGGKRQLLAAG